MKKHLLGLAIFSFIFSAFAFVFAVSVVPPIPQIAEVKVNYIPENSVSGYRQTSCFRGNRKKLSVEVINSHYITAENKIISKIKFVWTGADVPPEKINSITMFSSSENGNENLFSAAQIFENPFLSANEKIVTVVTKISGATIRKQDNLYVISSVFDPSNWEHSSGNKISSETKEVLTIH